MKNLVRRALDWLRRYFARNGDEGEWRAAANDELDRVLGGDDGRSPIRFGEVNDD